MVLDTSAKKFKYSSLKKIICVILCFLTFASSCVLITDCILTQSYASSSEESESTDWTDNDKVMYTLTNNVKAVEVNTYMSDYCKDIKQNLYLNENKFIDEIYSQYLNYSDSLSQYYETGYYETSDGDDISDSIYVSLYTLLYEDMAVGTLGFEIDLYELYINCYMDDTLPDKEEIREYIKEQYELYVSDFEPSSYETYDYTYTDSLRIYTKYNGSNSGNTEYSPSSARNYPYYIIYENGELEYAGFSDKIVNYISENVINENDYSKDTVLCVYFTDFSNISLSDYLTNSRYWNDYYISLYFFDNYNIINRTASAVAVSAILLVISIACALSFLKVFGRNEEGDTVTLKAYEKIPLEIHFLISVCVITALIFLWDYIRQEAFTTEYSIMFIIVSTIVLAVIWAVLFEFSACVSKCVGSGEPIKERFALYKIKKLFSIWVLSLKSRLSYKPALMKKYLVLYFLLYLFGNLALVILFAVMWFCNFIVAILIFVIWVVINIVTVSKIFKYFINLDIIISAFSKGEKPGVDADRLQSSLKVLNDSINNKNDELEAAVNKAVKDERLRSELITNVSHDLKTPLTSIINYVDLLSKCNIEGEKEREYISVLSEKGEKLKKLIEDLIEASKVTSGNVTVNFASINLSELALQCTVEAQPEFEKANLNLVVKDCEAPPIVTADGSKTHRVIENLLSNARKYSADGSRVYVEVYDSGDYGVFEIKNISAEPLNISPDELTERFVRGDKSRNREGNGLGLSIAKELCTLQNGFLELTIDGDLFKAKVKLPK